MFTKPEVSSSHACDSFSRKAHTFSGSNCCGAKPKNEYSLPLCLKKEWWVIFSRKLGYAVGLLIKKSA